MAQKQYVTFPGSTSFAKWFPVAYGFGGYNFMVDKTEASSVDQLKKDIAAAKKEGKIGVPFCDFIALGLTKDADESSMERVTVYGISSTTTSDAEKLKWYATHVDVSGTQVALSLQSVGYGTQIQGAIKRGDTEDETEISRDNQPDDKTRLEGALSAALGLNVDVKS